MLTIGAFSKLCLTTRKTLRHYDEIGLLRPQRDAANGYRYYTQEQLHTMRLINRLKGYGFSLTEIALVLSRRDDGYLADRLLEKREALRLQMDREQRLLEQLSADADNARKGVDILTQQLEIRTKEYAPKHIYSIRKIMGIQDYDDAFTQAYQEAAKQGLQFAGPAVALYHDEDFNPERSDIEVGLIVQGDPAIGRRLDPGLCAYLRYEGPYDSHFSDTYSLLGEWIDANGYEMNGAPFDVYIQGASDPSLSPSEYITEVYFPIRKRA